MYCAIHNNEVLACCDKELLGKKVRYKDIEIEIKESFYGKKEIDEKKLAELLKEFKNINLIGNKTVNVAIREGIVSEKNVMEIDKIKHTVIIKI
ncbi:MAG: DUF424 family protein [Candidatus Diapherotrites archaeon]|nr:DUF424 family protein [Candidatus Diapherotrites archaeon]